MKAVALCALLALGVQSSGPIEHVVPQRDSGQAQLELARTWKGRFRGQETPEERERWRRLAVEAYRAVRHYHPQARAQGAEAAFRAGELLRAAGKVNDAEAEFRVARTLGAGTPFRARAQLELGHAARRREAWRVAIECYLDVALEERAARKQRDDAMIWAGRAWEAEGRHDEARRAWGIVARGQGDALLRVRAHDAIALSFVRDEDLEAAAGALHACFVDFITVSHERSELGRDVRAALARMGSVTALQRAIARRALKDQTENAEKALTR